MSKAGSAEHSEGCAVRRAQAAPGHGQAEQLFGREAEGVLLVHRRQVVEPIEIGDRLWIGLVLDQLLGAAMQQPEMRVDALDDLAVELQHQAQHAMRRRVLRPEIDGEVAQGCFGHHTLSASLADFAATEALNRSQATTKRSCRPAPIWSTPSWALIWKVTRLPTTCVHSTSTV